MNRFLVTPDEAIKISKETTDAKDALFATAVYNKFLQMAEKDPILSECDKLTNSMFALAAVYHAGYVQARREARRDGR